MRLLKMVIGFVELMCQIDTRVDFTQDTEPLLNESKSLLTESNVTRDNFSKHLSTSRLRLLYTLKLRQLYGGMAGDMRMIEQSIVTIANRSKSNLPVILSTLTLKADVAIELVRVDDWIDCVDRHVDSGAVECQLVRWFHAECRIEYDTFTANVAFGDEYGKIVGLIWRFNGGVNWRQKMNINGLAADSEDHEDNTEMYVWSLLRNKYHELCQKHLQKVLHSMAAQTQ